MSTKLGTLVLTLVATLGTGCCWFDQCGYYNQCGPCGAYDPCTGLVEYPAGPFAKCRAKKLMKNMQKEKCDCDKDDCDCRRHHDHGSHGGCSCQQGTSRGHGVDPSGCIPCQSYGPSYGEPVYGAPVYGEPIYGEPVYGEPVYEDGMETYYVPESYPELMVPQETTPGKPVPAPPAAEPDQLPQPKDSSIPPVSYEAPAPLDGPSVPVLKPYDGR